MHSQIWQKHPKLYHYTTDSGFSGIWETQRLWATNFTSLNDSTELRQLRPLLEKALRANARKIFHQLYYASSENKRVIKENGGISRVATDQATFFMDALYKITLGDNESQPYFDPYIASFCTHELDTKYEQDNGLLSQWRGYSNNDGLAVVFNTKKIWEMLEQEWQSYWYASGGIGEVVYDRDNLDIDVTFPELAPKIRDMLSEAINPRNDGEPEYQDIYYPFTNAISYFKHRAFREEREIRICASLMTDHVLSIERENPNFDENLRPRKSAYDRPGGIKGRYIELFDSTDEPLPIERIIVGPSKDRVERAAKIEKMVKSKRIHVTCSETPLVR